MANEAELLLEEGSSGRVAVVYSMLALGYAFPARRGGTGFCVRNQVRRALDSGLDHLAVFTRLGCRRGGLGLLGMDKVGDAG